MISFIIQYRSEVLRVFVSNSIVADKVIEGVVGWEKEDV